MVFSIKIDTDRSAFGRALSQLPADLKKNISESLRVSAKEIAGSARKRVRAGSRARKKTGGNAPFSRTGNLAKSIGYHKINRDGLAYTITSDFYGRYLEFGTNERFVKRRGKRISRGAVSPRPFFMPSSTDQRRYDERIGSAVEAALRQFARR